MNPLKIILVTLGTAAFLSAAAILILKKRKAGKEAYWKTVKPGGELEARYSKPGPFAVSYTEYDVADPVLQKIEIWYPSEMQSSKEIWPAVIMANGTGMRASAMKEVFAHLASWGFIVAGNEDENSRTGKSSEKTLNFLTELNSDPQNPFYQKIDTDQTGIAGHSQGGVGAMNAVTEQPGGGRYKALWAVSPTSRFYADALNQKGPGRTCCPEKIRIPVFLSAGTKYFDAGNLSEYTREVPKGKAQGICPLWWLEECHEAIPDNTPKAAARRNDADHGDVLKKTDGYMSARFLSWLRKDEEAGRIFSGSHPEILKNPYWQDIQLYNIKAQDPS